MHALYNVTTIIKYTSNVFCINSTREMWITIMLAFTCRSTYPLKETNRHFCVTQRNNFIIPAMTGQLYSKLSISNTRYLKLCPNSNKTLGPFSFDSSGATTRYLELFISRTFSGPPESSRYRELTVYIIRITELKYYI